MSEAQVPEVTFRESRSVVCIEVVGGMSNGVDVDRGAVDGGVGIQCSTIGSVIDGGAIDSCVGVRGSTIIGGAGIGGTEEPSSEAWEF